MAKLSVHLVAWNGAKYIPHALASLRAQTYKDWEFLAIDNNSTQDNTADLIEQELRNFPVPVRLIRNKQNLGFAKGHNQAVRETASEYFQLYNQDIVLAPDYLEKAAAMMDAHPEAGAGQGVLLKWNFQKMENGEWRTENHNPSQPPLILRGGESGLTEIIDTMGLKVMRSRRVVDWRTGLTYNNVIPDRDRGSRLNSNLDSRFRGNDKGMEVFGVSGALPIYRRQAIEEVMFEGAMFDDEFGSYKEDVDLAFRLRSAGWKAYVAPDARAWHDRTAAGPREMSDEAAMKNRKGRPTYVNYYSYRNHLIVLLKNEHRANLAKDWPWIVWYELRKLVFMVLFDRATFKGLRDIWKSRKRIMEKRAAIMANYKVQPEEMRRWFM